MAAPTTTLSLSPSELCQFGTPPSPEEAEESEFDSFELLLRAQLNRNLLLFRSVDGEKASSHHPPRPSRIDSIKLMQRVQDLAPRSFARVMSYPHVSRFLSACAQGKNSPAEIRTSLSLQAIAAAMAIRAEFDFELEIPSSTSSLLLPSLGKVIFNSLSSAPIIASGKDGRYVIERGDEVVTICCESSDTTSQWLDIRQLRAAGSNANVAIDLDDVAPIAGSTEIVPFGRLTDEEVGSWQALFEEAWAILEQHHSGWARAVNSILQSVAPLERVQDVDRSVSSAEAFGTCMLTKPANGLDFAVALVHESQHNKLNAILTFTPMTKPRAGLHYAPWRFDPRPLAGNVHGIYAFFGVTDFWRVQRNVGTALGADTALAHFEFARWRGPLLAAIESALSSNGLTDAGVQLLAQIHEVVRPWMSEEVPATPHRLAELVALDHRVNWKLLNHQPDPDLIGELASAWMAGAEAPRWDQARSSIVIVPNQPSARARQRQRLAKAALREAVIDSEWEPSDLALLRGDLAAATQLYTQHLCDGSDATEDWAGMLLATQSPVKSHPEVLRALFGRLCEGGVKPSPLALESWMAAGRARATLDRLD